MARLKEELEYENEQMEKLGSGTPDFLKTFTEEGIWSVCTFTPGNVAEALTTFRLRTPVVMTKSV